jgi:hypothetical protein
MRRNLHLAISGPYPKLLWVQLFNKSSRRLVPKRDPLLPHPPSLNVSACKPEELQALKIVGIHDAGIGFPGRREDPVESEQLPVLAI